MALGVTAHRPYAGDDVLPSTAWHPEFEDVNNDGLMDLFVTKGNVEAQCSSTRCEDPSNLLLGQPDGTFVEGAEAAGIVASARARGARSSTWTSTACSTSSVVRERERAAVAQRRAGDADGSGADRPLGRVELEQPGANRDAIGAWVEIGSAIGSSSAS